MNLGIAGKRALVVGASRDSGLAVTDALLQAGCTVYAVARDRELLAKLERDAGGKLEYLATDLMAHGATHNLVRWLNERGLPDIVVHVIGGSVGVKDPLSSTKDWSRVWYYNLGIAVEINRAILPELCGRGWGRIVHFSSNACKLAIGAPPYASAKAAVEEYVRTMGKTYAKQGVVITAVRPGPIETAGRFMYSQDANWTEKFQNAYVPIGRWGKPQELARVVAFLCSDGSSYMPGAIVDVDGGMR